MLEKFMEKLSECANRLAYPLNLWYCEILISRRISFRS